MHHIHLKQIVTEDLAGLRLDQALAKLLPQFSRSQMQIWIESSEVTVDHKVITKNRERIYPGQTIELSVNLEDKDEWQAEQIPLDIIFEDESLFVINKPPGLVVHPGAGNLTSTLVNALLYQDTNLKKVPRAGLIHRLDKDTSGLLLVARNLESHHFLTNQMQSRQIHRIYEAIVCGQPRPTGTIDLPIGRHPVQRTKMSVLQHGGRPAKTHYKVLEKFSAHAYLEIELETGRTHQIRVHMAYINHPILGDPLYGRPRNYENLNAVLRQQIMQFKRQALHAKKIAFRHPVSGEFLMFESPLPADFAELLESLRDYGSSQR